MCVGALRPEQLSLRGDGREPVQVYDTNIDVQNRLHSLLQIDELQGMSSHLEEASVDVENLGAQDLLPQLGDCPLGRRARRALHVVTA